MEKKQVPGEDARHRRVNRLKKGIVLWMLLPVGLCMVLFYRVNALSRQLEDTQESLRQLLETVEQGQTSETGQDTVPQPSRTESHVKASIAGAEGMEGLADSLKVEQEIPEAAHKVYLTFDDGPSKYTEDILDILDTYDVKATFFVLGKEDEHSIEMLREIARRGHTIGMHSYSHKYADIYGSLEAFSADYYRIYSYILENTGIQSTCYRFPGGSSNTISDLDMQIFADFLEEQEVVFYDWNISSEDAGRTLLDVDALVENATADILKHGTSIILMHDAASRPTTVEALPEIIEKILAMEDTEILPITEETTPIQHIHKSE
ncbi:MAG: polysaccharide deacetylase [Lachnospiraceae bacterium]|nr:polysaccharide deacetylase [Lachnospiraceae bacterium]